MRGGDRGGGGVAVARYFSSSGRKLQKVFMYRDKDRQREKTRERVRRYRALHRGGICGVVDKGVTVTPFVVEMPDCWGSLADYEVWSPGYVVRAVPSWRVQKDAQIARFLRGLK